jgi:Ca2+-binding RTX toxin-like protein
MPANVEVLGLYGAADFGRGNSGDNTLIGGALPDILSGEGGNDQVWGLAGNDTLSGGPGNDVLIGGDGTNSMSGGLGDDQFIISSSADQITENAGQGNEIVWSTASYILPANVETLALLFTGAPINGLGNDQANTIIGTSTDNQLYGNGGNDYLIGGFGNDGFVGGFGNDTLNLGPGSDYIVYGSPQDEYDFVLDFQSIDDAFVFNGANFGFAPGTSPTLGFNLFINSNPIFTTPSFAYNTPTGILTFDYDGGGTGASPLQIAALTNHAAIDVSDFVFV